MCGKEVQCGLILLLSQTFLVRQAPTHLQSYHDGHGLMQGDGDTLVLVGVSSLRAQIQGHDTIP